MRLCPGCHPNDPAAREADRCTEHPPWFPEDRCQQCGGPNIPWSAPSPLWNEVMRGGDINGPWRHSELVCPICFVQAAEAAGIASGWRLSADAVHVPLQLVTPSGRVWNEATQLWDEPTEAHDAIVAGTLVITAYGTPVTQGSIRSLGAGRPSVHSNASRLKPWRSTVHEAALDAMRLADRHDGPVQVRLLFCFDRPAGHYGSGRNSRLLRALAPACPITRNSGDIDKLARGVLDSLTDAGVWQDDSQVVDLRCRKTWAGDEGALPIPGVRIEVRPVTG